jgi:hypothetical protein
LAGRFVLDLMLSRAGRRRNQRRQIEDLRLASIACGCRSPGCGVIGAFGHFGSPAWLTSR